MQAPKFTPPIGDIEGAALTHDLEMFSASPTDGRASGTITFTGQPAVGNSLTIQGKVYRFGVELPIGASVDETGAKAVEVLNRVGDGTLLFSYDSASNVITVTYYRFGPEGNDITLAKTGTNIAVAGLTGGARSEVSSVLRNYIEK